VSALVTVVVGYFLLFAERRIGLALDPTRAASMLAFGLPLVPASLAGWVLNLSDRYLVNAFDGRGAVGVYAAGSTVGMAINALAVAPFTLAWGAAYWEIARGQDARPVIARVLTGFTGLACFGALALSALATDAFRILLTPEFEAGRFVTPFSAFASVGYGLFTIVTTGINLEGETRRVPIIIGLAALANLALNLALIPFLGPMGAAISTLLSYALLAIVGGISSQRVYAVAWDVARVAMLIGLAMALAAAALLGPDHVAWRLACIAAYPAVVLGLGIMPRRATVELLRLARRP
jgi:O-antigen/teichoic acid export membrane protein